MGNGRIGSISACRHPITRRQLLGAKPTLNGYFRQSKPGRPLSLKAVSQAPPQSARWHAEYGQKNTASSRHFEQLFELFVTDAVYFMYRLIKRRLTGVSCERHLTVMLSQKGNGRALVNSRLPIAAPLCGVFLVERVRPAPVLSSLLIPWTVLPYRFFP